jgi:hypothetical protein
VKLVAIALSGGDRAGEGRELSLFVPQSAPWKMTLEKIFRPKGSGEGERGEVGFKGSGARWSGQRGDELLDRGEVKHVV